MGWLEKLPGRNYFSLSSNFSVLLCDLLGLPICRESDKHKTQDMDALYGSFSPQSPYNIGDSCAP